ncbi:MAG: FeoB-associated Cys-rich membrane protein [Oscillospiraceae bacterium]|nr:FeoB-associated Cys-rich membrane protein [Oscillospiraceae bacterium]MBR2636567.1 FeoB-associated Cys-rich membrane protein [Oscillospiraceae bacterium]
MGDIIVIAVLILCVALIIRNMIKTRKKGGCAGCSGCSGGCSTCAKYMANNTKK